MADQKPQDEHTMPLAKVLMDLATLRACAPNAALALVSARSSEKEGGEEKKEEEQDKDLKRAKELLALHYGVREAHKKGELGRGLEEARSMVERAVNAD